MLFIPHRYSSGPSYSQIILDDVSCSSSSYLHILQCSNDGIYSNNCGHSEDVAVVCCKCAFNSLVYMNMKHMVAMFVFGCMAGVHIIYTSATLDREISSRFNFWYYPTTMKIKVMKMKPAENFSSSLIPTNPQRRK